MANTGTNSIWDRIQQGVRDTERLLGQKQYNLSMIKARQTLECMVRCLRERAGIAGGDLMDVIDDLYQNGQISKTTCEHYHKIRMIGNKAAHEGSDNAYDANQAYHLLSQEILAFANEYYAKRKAPRSAPASRSGSRSSSHSSTVTRSRKRAPQRRKGLSSRDLLRLFIPIGCVVVLIIIILFFSGKRKDAQETTETTTTEAQPTTAPPESMPETQTQPETEPETIEEFIYKTTASVNVRPQPNQEQAPLGKLNPGTVVDYVGTSGDEWAIINYNGQEAYISNQFLTAVPANAANAVYKTTDTVNVRPEPNTDQAPLGKLNAGSTVTYIGPHNDEWAIINYNGTQAYISSQFLTTE